MQDKPNYKYVEVKWVDEHEYKEGDIISMHGFTLDDKSEYVVVESKQLNKNTVELKVKLMDTTK